MPARGRSARCRPATMGGLRVTETPSAFLFSCVASESGTTSVIYILHRKDSMHLACRIRGRTRSSCSMISFLSPSPVAETAGKEIEVLVVESAQPSWAQHIQGVRR
jgi:hypothetical protein